MILRSAKVNDFRLLKQPVSVDFGPGLNVIHGPNESGKTTLMEAIWCGLTLRSRATGLRVDELVPHAGGIPTVELVFDHGGFQYTLLKCFDGHRGQTSLRFQPTASHHATEQQLLEGDAAEDRVRLTMGLGESAGRARAGDEHLGVWPLLWVREGESGIRPSVRLFDGGRRSLGERLAAIAGEVLAGSGGEQTIAAVRTEYSRYFSEKQGKERTAENPLKTARDQLEAANSHLEMLSQRQAEYSEAVDRYAELGDKVRGLSAQLPKLFAGKHQLQQQGESLGHISQRANAARAELQAATARHTQLQQLMEQFDSLHRDREQAESRAADATVRIGILKAELVALESPENGQEQSLETLKEELHAADLGSRHLQTHLDAQRCRERIHELTDRLKRATASRERSERLKTQIEDIPASESVMQELERLERRHEQAMVAVHAAGAAIRVVPTQSTSIKLGSRTWQVEASTEWSQQIEEPTRFKLGDLAIIEVVPGGLEVGNFRRQAQETEKAIKQRLNELGFKSVNAARRMREARHRYEVQLQSAEITLEQIAPDGTGTIEDDLAAHRQELEPIELQLAEMDVNTSYPEDSRALLATQVDIERRAQQSRERLESALSGMASKSTARESLIAKISAAESELLAHTERVKQIETRVEALSKTVSIEKLRQELAQNTAAVVAKRGALESIEAEVRQAGGDQLDQALGKVAHDIASIESELELTRRQHHTLEGYLMAADLMGLHEALKVAEAERDRAKARFEPLAQHAAAIRLLHNTLEETRDRARQSVVEPLRRTVSPLVQSVFGDTGLAFDEQFAVEKVHRGGSSDLFEQLSGGTKEQLALLIRLGMAKVLAKGEKLTVMLDDTLVATDKERFSRIVDVLIEVSESLQIILYTCHWERYESQTAGLANTIAMASINRL